MLGIQDNPGLAKDVQRRLFPLPEGELMSDTITVPENASTAPESEEAAVRSVNRSRRIPARCHRTSPSAEYSHPT